MTGSRCVCGGEKKAIPANGFLIETGP